jgi:hypothetical protein
MIFTLLFLGCMEPAGDITLSGQILTRQDSGAGAAGITVNIRDSMTDPYTETVTDEDGEFSLLVPANAVYHMILSGEEVASTAFSGVAGQEDLAIPSDLLFVRTLLEVDAYRAAFQSCAASDLSGGIAEGILEYRLQNTTDDSFLIAEEAFVEAFDANGTQYETCYLDNDGESLELGAAVGATGRFIAFGIPEGPTTLIFKQDFGGLKIENYAFVYMPEGGIAPFHPAFIDLAG